MKLFLDKDGKPEFDKDGLPMYVLDDGSKVPFDALAAATKITNLTEEKTRHWTALQSAKTEIDKFSPLKNMEMESILKALDTVKNLDAKKMIDAGEVEILKKQMTETLEAEKKSMAEGFLKKEDGYKGELESLNTTIYDLLVTSQFATSDLFSGQDPKTILPPEMAATYFGKNFKIEGKGKEAKVVGYIGEDKIMSKKNLGEAADFNEAISVIIDKYPLKERILRSSDGGSGANGHKHDLDKTGNIRLPKEDQLDPMKYQAAKKMAAEKGVELILG